MAHNRSAPATRSNTPGPATGVQTPVTAAMTAMRERAGVAALSPAAYLMYRAERCMKKGVWARLIIVNGLFSLMISRKLMVFNSPKTPRPFVSRCESRLDSR
ncbi:hypothetical protein EYC84_004906 [Monilinia fructicola]|nr:hypothetical protein EYC84_004906 [Monilinia fructicola]